jgi:hypothetical protein
MVEFISGFLASFKDIVVVFEINLLETLLCRP